MLGRELMPVQRTEAMIQRAILEYLATVPGCYHFRAGSGAFQTAAGRYVKTGRPGVPDIIVCRGPGGRWVGLEVKTEKGRQSEAQKQAEADIRAAGGEYHIVRSVADVRAVICK